MAIAADGTDTQGTTTGNQLVISRVVTTGNFLAVCVGFTDTSGTNRVVTAAAYNGVAMTKAKSQYDSGGQNRCEIWYMVAPATGTHNCVVDFTGTVRVAGTVISLSGVNQSTPIGTAVSATANSGNPLTVNATSADGELVLDCAEVGVTTNVPLTVGAGQTVLGGGTQLAVSGAGASGGVVGASSEAGAASVTMSWTQNGNEAWVICAVPIKPVAASGKLLNSIQVGPQVGASPINGPILGIRPIGK